MSGEKLLLITFDYELFLGEKSGTPQDCLLDPTDKLLSCLDRHSFKAVFFIDTVYLLYLKKMAEKHPEANRDLRFINGQLLRIVQSGHEIHPHIHPHWTDAQYDAGRNEWNLKEKKHYTFSSLSPELRKDLFAQSVHYIQSIVDLAKSDQPVDSYRAGGWSIQPFEHFRPLFIQYEIKYEWSIIPGKYQISDAHSFDFRKAPAGTVVYNFNEDPCLNEKNGQFTELTISSLTLNQLETWIDFKISGMLKRFGMRPAYKGKAVSSIINEEGDLYRNGQNRRIIASFEGLNPFTVKKYISTIGSSRYFQFISHPKLITPYEFRMIDQLFGKLKMNYEIQTDFRKSLPD